MGRGETSVTVVSNESHLITTKPQGQVVADYIYQGATILAALLIVLSAAV
jgi:hypothetical protein